MKAINPPPLTDKSKPWVVISFIHSDGKEHKFYSVVNEMSGSRLSAFDSSPPGIDEGMPWVKSVIRDIRRKAEVTGFSSTKHFNDL